MWSCDAFIAEDKGYNVVQQKIYSLELLQTKCKCLVMPRTQEQLRKRVLELQILHRSQAVKIWELEEEKMNLVKELERIEDQFSMQPRELILAIFTCVEWEKYF